MALSTSAGLEGTVIIFNAALYTSPKSSRRISKTWPKLPSPSLRWMTQLPKTVMPGLYRCSMFFSPRFCLCQTP